MLQVLFASSTGIVFPDVPVFLPSSKSAFKLVTNVVLVTAIVPVIETPVLEVSNLEEYATQFNVMGHAGIGHTRWATHGLPNDINAHPHVSMDGSIALIHNGIIENYDSLRKELISQGYVFKSETDTEVVVHLIDQALQLGKTPENAVKETLSKLHRGQLV